MAQVIKSIHESLKGADLEAGSPKDSVMVEMGENSSVYKISEIDEKLRGKNIRQLSMVGFEFEGDEETSLTFIPRRAGSPEFDTDNISNKDYRVIRKMMQERYGAVPYGTQPRSMTQLKAASPRDDSSRIGEVIERFCRYETSESTENKAAQEKKADVPKNTGRGRVRMTRGRCAKPEEGLENYINRKVRENGGMTMSDIIDTVEKDYWCKRVRGERKREVIDAANSLLEKGKLKVFEEYWMPNEHASSILGWL